MQKQSYAKYKSTALRSVLSYPYSAHLFIVQTDWKPVKMPEITQPAYSRNQVLLLKWEIILYYIYGFSVIARYSQ